MLTKNRRLWLALVAVAVLAVALVLVWRSPDHIVERQSEIYRQAIAVLEGSIAKGVWEESDRARFVDLVLPRRKFVPG